MYLNTTTISNPNLLILPLISLLVYKLDYIQNPTFYILIDPGFIYYFICTKV